MSVAKCGSNVERVSRLDQWKCLCMVSMVKSIEMTFVSTRFFFFVNKMMFNTRYTNKEDRREEKRTEAKRRFTVSLKIRIGLISFLVFDFPVSNLPLVFSIDHFLVPNSRLSVQFGSLSFVEHLVIVSQPDYSFVDEPNTCHLSFHPERIARNINNLTSVSMTVTGHTSTVCHERR